MFEERLAANKMKREIWVDNVKVIACILVVLGHFFQSMIKSDIFSENDMYKWFNQTIYYFHVPLFFVCSGYLYQNLSKMDDAHKMDAFHNWGRNVAKKALNLGVPYFTFSFATWLLKTVFSSSTNTQIGGLADTLFLHPASPYWFLYALFFIFLITPIFRNNTMACIGLVVASGMKLLGIIRGDYIPVISYVLGNEIWFVIGMCMSVFEFRQYLSRRVALRSAGTFVLFIVLSVMAHKVGIQNGFISLLLGLMACISIITWFAKRYADGRQTKAFGFLAEYTMPIFLMHTLFAAPFRGLLLKIGIRSAAVHVMIGLSVSFAGPIIAAEVIRRSKWLEFFLYPVNLLKWSERGWKNADIDD